MRTEPSALLEVAALLCAAAWVHGCDSRMANGGSPGDGAAGGRPAVAPDDISTILASYEAWQPQTAQPVDISAYIFQLCRGPTPSEASFASSVHGRRGLRDWANPAAVAGLAALGKSGFGVGAAIVKQKFLLRPGDGAWELASIGIMVKRDPGFDRKAGDWEFAYWDPVDGITRGGAALPGCTTCHADAGTTDFVYVGSNWRAVTGP